MSRHPLRLLTWMVPLVLLAAGCGGDATTEEPQQPPAEEQQVASRYGQPYAFSEGRHPDAPAPLPHVEGDTLVAHVSYTGGCTDHAFELRHDRSSDTLRLWLQHQADEDTCTQRVYQTVRAPLPSASAATTVLMTPDEGPPLVLE